MMDWSLFNKKEYLEPLVFSNGKSQLDVAKEVIQAIKEGHKIIFIKGICGTGKCLERDSSVFCKPNNENHFSYHKISELVGKGGDILALDRMGKIIESKFKNVRNTGIKKLYKIKTRTGREIVASANHPLLTITKEGIEWLPLEKLNNYSYICLPNKISFGRELDYDNDKIKILAHLIAEGKLGDKAGSPIYYQSPNKNPEIRKDYISSLRRAFPDGEIKSYCEKDVAIVFRNMNTTKGATNKLRLFIREHGLDKKKSSQKFIPKIIFNLKKEKISLFLSRLFSCDGSIYQKKKDGQITIEYSSISKRLIQDVSLLLQRFGIQHTITSKKFKENKEYAWIICISNHNSIRKYIDEIGFVGRKQRLALKLYNKLKIHKFTNIDKVPRVIREYLKKKGYNYTELDRFLNYEKIEESRKKKSFKQIRKDKSIETPFVFNQQKIDFLRSHIKKINNYIKDDTLSFICNEDIFWDKVKSIEYIKKDETYDLEVPKNHNFIANGIIVHNSAVALNIAKEIGKTSIVVPVKPLQKQYEEDYTDKMHVLKKDGTKLNIAIIDGRNNHRCLFKSNCMADDRSIPCTIEIKEDNLNLLKEYLHQNKFVNDKGFKKLKDIRRKSIAPACPYWSPILHKDMFEQDYNIEDAEEINYEGLQNKTFTYFQREKGCKYYNQFLNYLNSDVIVFNSKKYELENLMDRKPATELEIIDECDEFLDNLANEKRINLDRLSMVLSNIKTKDLDLKDITIEINDLVLELLNDKNISEKEIFPIKKTKVYQLLKHFTSNAGLIDLEEEETDYLYNVYQTGKSFEDYFDETYVTFYRNDRDELLVNIITVDLEKKLKEFLDKNKAFVMMSGTIHSEMILKEVFGIKDFKIIEAEVNPIGRIKKIRTKLEKCFDYQTLKQNGAREAYLDALSRAVEVAEKPVLVHVNAFKDLPSHEECLRFNITNLKTKEELMIEQNEYRRGELVKKFKDKEIEVLFSTKCNRGVDFPGEICNSIIFTKYPYPNVSSLFWQILKKSKPEYYSMFYKDKAEREFLQRVYRGLRSEKDHINILSPDIRILNSIGLVK